LQAVLKEMSTAAVPPVRNLTNSLREND
jgi:hypothetical protein